jgi:hypothetical protein
MKKASGTNYFVGYTNVPQMLITANATTFTVAVSTADGSTLDLTGSVTQVMDGLVEQIWRDADLFGVNSTTPQAGIGGGFAQTAAGGGLLDVELYLQTVARRFKLSPSLMIMSPTTLGQFSAASQSVTNGPQTRVTRDANGSADFVPGTRMKAYPNQYIDGADNIPILSHPLAPDGEIVYYVKTVNYPGANVGVNLQFHCTEHLVQDFIAKMTNVAPPGPWQIITTGAFALIFGRPCGFQNNFF